MNFSGFGKKILALFCFALGTTLLVLIVIFPILESQDYGKRGFTEPGVLFSYRAAGILGADDSRQAFGELAQSLPQSGDFSEDTFYLNIPKLKITSARVRANSKDLNPKGFIGHLAGSAFPGEEGVSFLYGHSVLPWFFNPQDYNTVFSTIHKLDFGDAFSIDAASQPPLVYEVVYKVVLEPGEVIPFTKGDYFGKSSGSWVILMTCTPPGLDTKRMLVIGKRR